MLVTDLWESKGKPSLSFELLPPRDDKAAGRLTKAIDKLAELQPDFVSVTFGAGGSTREGSYALVEHLMKERKLEVLAYFTCYGLGPDAIVSALDAYRDLGVQNVLAVRGDPPHDQEDFQPHPQSLKYASDLVEFVAPKYDFCLGVAGYPEGHLEAKSPEADLGHLKNKVDRGAHYLITNYCYDNQYFLDFRERCQQAGIQVPILPGVMPIYSVKMMEKLASLCGATIVDGIRDGLAKLPEGDKDALFDFSVDFAVNQCKGLLEAGVPGLHLYTMDRSKACVAIVSRLRADGLL